MVCFNEWLDEPTPEQGPPRPQGFKDGSLGYCQALFEREREPGVHTAKMIRLLTEAGFPHERSHELVVAHQNGYGLGEFVDRAIEPLACEDGSAPILITPYDVAEDAEKIDQILLCPVKVNGTILVRVLLKSEESVEAAVRLLNRLADRVAEHQAQGGKGKPIWWPLIQNVRISWSWLELADQLGENTKYLKMAVNPWTTFPPELTHLIKVAQIPVGPSDGVGNDGLVALGPVKVSGAPDDAHYDLASYLQTVKYARPTRIILGPTPGWGDAENLARVGKVVSLLQRAGVT